MTQKQKQKLNELGIQLQRIQREIGNIEDSIYQLLIDTED